MNEATDKNEKKGMNTIGNITENITNTNAASINAISNALPKPLKNTSIALDKVSRAVDSMLLSQQEISLDDEGRPLLGIKINY